MYDVHILSSLYKHEHLLSLSEQRLKGSFGLDFSEISGGKPYILVSVKTPYHYTGHNI